MVDAKLKKDGSPRKKPGPKGPRKPKSQPELVVGPDELDDLLGISPKAPRGQNSADLAIEDVYRGVSVTWLANAFKMDRNTVKKRLAHCPSVSNDRSTPLYSLRQAASYLVEPKVDIASYLKAMRPNDLPPLLQDTFWSAQMKRQKWEVEAGNLWPTEDVLEVLSEAARRIRSAITLWTDNLDRVNGLNSEQRKMLTGMCDGLLDEIHETLIDMPRQKRTPSQLAQLSDMEADESGRVMDINEPV